MPITTSEFSTTTPSTRTRAFREAPPGAAKDVFRAYSGTLLGAIGGSSVGWSIREPDTLYVRFLNADLAHLGDNVLRDTIRGATIKAIVDPSYVPNPAPPAQPPATWTDSSYVQARAVAALNGVWSTDIEWGRRSASFAVVSEKARVAMKELVSDKLGELTPSFYVSVPRPPAPPKP